MNINRLDAVWASLSAGDRIMLLGHDRDLLDDADKARLGEIAEQKADRNAKVARKVPVRNTGRNTNKARRTPASV